MKRRISSTSPASRNAPARCGPPSSRIEVMPCAPSWSSAERMRAGSFSPGGDDHLGAGGLERVGGEARGGPRDDDDQRHLVRAADELGVERQPRLGVEDDARRLPEVAVDARGQLRVVGQRGADPDHDGVALGAPVVGAEARVLARDPLRVAGVGGDLAVERHRGLEEHLRAAGAGVLAERLVEAAGAARRARRRRPRPRRPRRAGCRARGRRPSRSGRRRRPRRARARPRGSRRCTAASGPGGSTARARRRASRRPDRRRRRRRARRARRARPP